MNARRDAVNALCELAGADVERFVAGTLVKDVPSSERSWTLHGQRLTVETVRRDTPWACPLCLSQDVEGVGRPSELAYARSIWSVEHLRTCARHEVALVSVGPARDLRSRHDNQCLYGDLLERLPEACRQASPRKQSNLEAYLSSRFTAGVGGNHWFDALPLNVVALLVERVGMVLTAGRQVNVLALSDDQLWAAGQAGFEALCHGEDGLRSVLEELRRTFPYGGSGLEGPQSVFGRLWHFLDRGASGGEFGPVKDIVRDHVVGIFPFAAGTKVLGQTLERRRLHSIRSASVETGRHPIRLRRLLIAAGVIPEGHEETSDNLVTFDAGSALAALSRLTAPMGMDEVEQVLGLPRMAPLVRDGLLEPLRDHRRRRLGKLEFAREDVESLLSRTLGRALHTSAMPKGCCDLHGAARKAKCRLAEIVTLLRDGRLMHVYRLPVGEGLGSLAVSVAEVSGLVRGEAHHGLAEWRIVDRLHVHRKAVRRLIEKNILPAHVVRDPVNRCPVRVVSETDVRSFEEQYVSLINLAKERGVHFRALKSDLDARGIRPALSAEIFKTAFYDRLTV